MLAVASALVITGAVSAPAFANFGIASFDGELSTPNGDAYTQAGGHPFAASTTIDLNRSIDSDGNAFPDGSLENAVVDLPAGFVGDPTATPTRCSENQLEAGGDFNSPATCPLSSQVGTAIVDFQGIGPLHFQVYNMIPPAGLPAQLGFKAASAIAHLSPSVRTGGDYGLTVHVDGISQGIPIFGTTLTLWGVPADPAHDGERGSCLQFQGPTGEECPTDAPMKPFLTLPTACTAPGVGLQTTLHVESWQGDADVASFFSHLPPGPPAPGPQQGPTGCGRLPFDPAVSVQPTSHDADSPTGLHVDLRLPQNDNPNGLAEAALKTTVVQLPAGLAVNPSAADGLEGCSPAEVNLTSPDPAACPDASKVGTVEIHSPLLDHPLPGAVYLATQGANPFNSLLALYIAVADPQTGVVVKLPGKVEPDPISGQLQATFKENPQLPFEDLEVDFFGGPRATLTTPPTCGSYATTTDLTPWSAPEGKDAFPTDSFPITTAPQGGPCAGSEAQTPNTPAFSAGTINPLAGTYSPFVLRMSRENGSQRFGALNVTLPAGLTGKLAGLDECSKGQIAAAVALANPGQGALEQASPSCPKSSEVGVVTVGAGSGSPLFVQGKAYLAGPYKGAPLSLAIITPAVAGPFDLGTVVVRTALYVNETTAQIHAVSDPIPSILAGIPLDIRSIALNMDKPSFTLNPTSCDGMKVLGTAISTLGQSAALSSPFQVGACAALGFKPNLAINLKGATKRGKFPALAATLTYPKGAYANIARASVALPHSEFLAQNHIRTVCTRVQFAAGAGNGAQCPKGSIYGKASARTPLLDKALSGPVYLRSSSHPLPDLVAALHGQIDVALVGRIDSVNGGIRSTFDSVPDAPVSKFTLQMQGGKKGLFVNSTNICKSTNRAKVKLDAQNGKVYDTNPVVRNSCGGKTKKKKHRHG